MFSRRRGRTKLLVGPSWLAQIHYHKLSPSRALVLAIAPKVSIFAEQAIYLRGSMNNWGVTNPMHRLDVDHYAVDVEMKAGAIEFKVATEDFQTIIYGAAAGQKGMVFGSPKSLTQGGGNAALGVVESDGTYTVTLDITRPNEPALSITRKTF